MDENEKYEPMSLEDYQVDLEDVDFGEEESEPTQDSEPEQVQEGESFDSSEPQEETPITQTPEQNAYYAEQRRQSLIEQRVQQELERVRQESPEFQMAQTLSNMYGVPVEELHQQLLEKQMEQQAEEQGIPVDVLRQLNVYEQQQYQLQEQLHFMQFQNWQNRVGEESKSMQTQYPMLTEQDIEQAKYFLLDTLRNPEIPLQNAVFALHGDKITNSLKELAKQEALAEISGRKKGGLPPQSMKSSDTVSLSEEERYVAKMMGLSEADYIKYK
jgi:hypothetical protein